jgi:hypothetical protein
LAELKYDPVKHDHQAFLDEASKRRGFREAYEALEAEYALAHKIWCLLKTIAPQVSALGHCHCEER